MPSSYARSSAWRIQNVAYVENLNPLDGSNFSAARISPNTPSCSRSCAGTLSSRFASPRSIWPSAGPDLPLSLLPRPAVSASVHSVAAA